MGAGRQPDHQPRKQLLGPPRSPSPNCETLTVVLTVSSANVNGVRAAGPDGLDDAPVTVGYAT